MTPPRAVVAALAALAVGWGGGCSSVLPRGTGSPALPAERLPPVVLDEVLAAYQAFAGSAETVSGAGELEVRDLRKAKARSLGVRLVAARGGRLYLKGSITVITALEVVADGTRFWLQVPSRKTVWTGPARTGADRDSGAEDGSAPYYALRPADILAALLPEPLAPEAADAVTLEADAREVSLSVARLEQGRGTVVRRIGLSRPGLEPRSLRAYDGRGELQSEILLGDFVAGRPRALEVRRPQEGYEARLRLSRLDVNVPVPERAFVPRTPPEYKTVEIQ